MSVRETPQSKWNRSPAGRASAKESLAKYRASEKGRSSSRSQRKARMERYRTDANYRESVLTQARERRKRIKKDPILSAAHKDKKKAQRSTDRAREFKRRSANRAYDRRRSLVFKHYGEACECCNESEKMFLTVDHPDNDGAKHRRSLRTKSIYVWLVQNGFPPGYRILCFNCNSGRYRNKGMCPHEIKRIGTDLIRQVLETHYVSEGSLS